MGIPEQCEHPDFDAAVRAIFRAARKAGVATGIHYSYGLEAEITWAREAGLNFLIHNSDVGGFVQQIGGDIGRLREELGDAAAMRRNGRPESLATRETTSSQACLDLCRDEEIECVLVWVPNALSVPIALEAVNNGKHAMVNKPLADSFDEEKRPVNAAETGSTVERRGISWRSTRPTTTVRDRPLPSVTPRSSCPRFR